MLLNPVIFLLNESEFKLRRTYKDIDISMCLRVLYTLFLVCPSAYTPGLGWPAIVYHALQISPYLEY